MSKAGVVAHGIAESQHLSERLNRGMAVSFRSASIT